MKGPDGYAYEPVWINPVDAMKQDIVDGDIVKLFNERGAVLGGAVVSERIMPGALYQDHGARVDMIVPGVGGLDRGGANNLICPNATTSKNTVGEVTNGFLVGIEKVDGIYLDLGVSSYQLDTADRGFTYNEDDAPLDMRMDQRNPMTAADIVNEYDEMDLYRITRDYGEDKFAKNIAKHIVKARQEKRIETAGELTEIIKAAIPMKMRAVGGHPSKRTFQAIRIELNHELDVLNDSIDTMIDLLNPGGRLSIITFHSLEDRIVKNRFRENENPCICPPDFPVCVCGRKSKGKVITRKPIVPTEEEIEENKRSKSSKLRVFERC